MKKMMFMAIVALAFVACNSQSKEKKTDEKNAETTTLTVDQFFEKGEALLGKEITIKGTIDHVCAHGGKKMFIQGSTPENRLRINAGDDIASFDVAFEGSTMQVTGKADMLKMDSAYLANWEQELIEGSHEKGSGTGDGTGHGEGQEEEGHEHDHSSHGEQADMGEHIPGMEKVKKYQEEIATNGKGYIPIYSLTAKKVKELK
jgi:hypothetical protein